MNPDSTRTEQEFGIVQKRAGRPSKLTDKFLRILKKIVNHNINAIIYTDIDIIMLTNNQLSENERIDRNRWHEWKVGNLKDNSGRLQKFHDIVHTALLQQKQILFDRYENDEKSWQKWSWIIERKFSEWNLKKLSETTVNSTVTIQLEEQKELDGLIGGMSEISMLRGSTTPKAIATDFEIEDVVVSKKESVASNNQDLFEDLDSETGKTNGKNDKSIDRAIGKLW